MTRVIVSPSADAEIDVILKHLAKAAGTTTAEKYSARFEDLFDRLAEFPGSCALRRSLGNDIRIGIVFPYVVVYRHGEADDTVKVLRVIHGRRNITLRMISD